MFHVVKQGSRHWIVHNVVVVVGARMYRQMRFEKAIKEQQSRSQKVGSREFQVRGWKRLHRGEEI